MRTVAFFNNKGGVGKTTLTANVAAHLSIEFNQKVLLVDADPQCNTTQLLLSEELCNRLYWEPEPPDIATLMDVVRPIEEGGPEIASSTNPMPPDSNRFRVSVLPGHPRMSIIEDLLSRSWGEASSGDLGGLRKTNWVTALRRQYEADYDLLFFDLGPSLGSLNRSVLLGCDFFVTPMGADIFSIVGVRNIADWLNDWLRTYDVALSLSRSKKYPTPLEHFPLQFEPPVKQGFVGYTIQQYITKSKQGRRRPTVAYEQILRDVPAEIERHIGQFFAEGIDLDSAKLGDVPSMYSLIPMAQSANAPIFQLDTKDGLVGSQYSQQRSYASTIRQLAMSLARNVGLEIELDLSEPDSQ